MRLYKVLTNPGKSVEQHGIAGFSRCTTWRIGEPVRVKEQVEDPELCSPDVIHCYICQEVEQRCFSTK